MSDLAIQVHGLSKQYRIGALQGTHRHNRVKFQYSTLRDTLAGLVQAPLRRASQRLRGQAPAAAEPETSLWALRDASFDIRQGEVVGIIGRNGAGKSTLLKVMSRITEPTDGWVDLYGRVGSLLEVGTGFHPELTGRENIYLNGTILGMRRQEVERKFDEIVDFSEVERFIDTPVKNYSSGMYLRLAFAVAAHLEPEILMVDEVLAVGDVRFQKKCMNKVQAVGQGGRTVLFVSHNMPAITRLCQRTILLDEGRIIADGPSPQVVGAYLNAGLGTSAAREWDDPARAPGGEVARLRAVRIRNDQGQITDAIDIRRPVAVEMEYDVLKPDYLLLPHFDLYNAEGVRLFISVDRDPAWRRRPRPVGRYRSTAWIPGNLLTEGTHFVEALAVTLEPPMLQYAEREAVAFEVIDSFDGDSARADWTGRMTAVMRPLLEWQTRHIEHSGSPSEPWRGPAPGRP